jgi:hypothetical protein
MFRKLREDRKGSPSPAVPCESPARTAGKHKWKSIESGSRAAPYGTFNVMVWLFEFVPEAAVTVIVYVPAWVPLGGVWVVP